MVVLVEGPAPQVMDAESENDNLERISLLSAGLGTGVEYLTAVVEVTQVGLVVNSWPFFFYR